MTEPQDEYFQEIIANYEGVITEITQVLDEVKAEQEKNKTIINSLLSENENLSHELKVVTSENPHFKYSENDLIKNLKEQVEKISEEKEYVTKLWSVSTDTIGVLEEQLKIYETSADGYVAKTEFVKIKCKYEDRIKHLQDDLEHKQKQYQNSTKNLKQELEMKNKEIQLSYNTKENTFKIIKNLEEEIVKLQSRLKESEKMKRDLDQSLMDKSRGILSLQSSNDECKRKVGEALELIDAAFQEKELAQLAERQSREELSRLSEEISHFKSEHDNKIEELKKDIERKHQQQIKRLEDDLKLRAMEVEKLTSECSLLQNEMKIVKCGHLHNDDSSTSKLLILEKNLENTFQKLLLSEKQNIQLTSERDSIKYDLEQMAGYYQRDISARETEKMLLKKEIQKLKIDVEETSMKLAENFHITQKIEEIEREYKEKLDFSMKTLHDKYEGKLEETKNERNGKIEELKTQLCTQIEKNKKWRNETKAIVEKLEKKILQFKVELTRLRDENNTLVEKLKEANNKLNEHLNYLSTISRSILTKD